LELGCLTWGKGWNVEERRMKEQNNEDANDTPGYKRYLCPGWVEANVEKNLAMTLLFHVTSPLSPIKGWVGQVVRRKTAGWVTLRFWWGIQWNFKAINLELVPRTEVPVPGEVTPDVSVDLDQEEAPGGVRYQVVSPHSAWDGEIGVLVASKTPQPEWVMLAFDGVSH